MEELILFLVFGVIMIVVALSKGFNPMCWFFAAGLLGLIILFFLPSVYAKDIDETEKLKRAQLGNQVGTVISIIALIFVGILILFAISNSDKPGTIIIPLLLIIIPLISISVSIFLLIKAKKIVLSQAQIAGYSILSLIVSLIIIVSQIILLEVLFPPEGYDGFSPVIIGLIAIADIFLTTYLLGLLLWRKKIRAKESEINPA
jgi:hypothetical protein